MSLLNILVLFLGISLSSCGIVEPPIIGGIVAYPETYALGHQGYPLETGHNLHGSQYFGNQLGHIGLPPMGQSHNIVIGHTHGVSKQTHHNTYHPEASYAHAHSHLGDYITKYPGGDYIHKSKLHESAGHHYPISHHHGHHGHHGGHHGHNELGYGVGAKVVGAGYSVKSPIHDSHHHHHHDHQGHHGHGHHHAHSHSHPFSGFHQDHHHGSHSHGHHHHPGHHGHGHIHGHNGAYSHQPHYPSHGHGLYGSVGVEQGPWKPYKHGVGGHLKPGLIAIQPSLSYGYSYKLVPTSYHGYSHDPHSHAGVYAGGQLQHLGHAHSHGHHH